MDMTDMTVSPRAVMLMSLLCHYVPAKSLCCLHWRHKTSTLGIFLQFRDLAVMYLCR